MQTYTQLGALKCIIDDHSRSFECKYQAREWVMVYEKDINSIRIYNKHVNVEPYSAYWIDSVWTEVQNG